MTVYVDRCIFKLNGRLWCHMMTDQDDLAELHDMAERIGVEKAWFQRHAAHPHYDLTTSRRKCAIRAGAVPVESAELVRRCSLLFKNRTDEDLPPATSPEGGAEMDNNLTLPCEVGDVSDGYHTFNELYEHRHVLFINVVMAHRDNAFKTWKDDKGETWEGWFILGINTKHGQISYHLPEEYWALVSVKEIECNSDYDGHAAKDVVIRLLLLAASDEIKERLPF